MGVGDPGKADGPDKKAGKSPSSERGPAAPRSSDGTQRQRRMLRIGIVGAAVVVAVVALLIVRGDDDGSEEPERASTGFEARFVDEEELEEIAEDAGHPVYWAGAMDGKELVVSEDEEGNVQVRYVDENYEAGRAVTIGSYPIPDPTEELKDYAERKGAIVTEAPDGRELVSNDATPTSVYFVSPDNAVQVEVYAPAAKRANSLARSGRVQPVG